MPDQLDIDPKLVKQVLQENELGADTGHHAGAAAVIAHIDLVSNGRQIVGACGRVFDI